MGKSKTVERSQGADLFINTDLTFKEVAAIIKVSPAKVSEWAKADNWETLRTAKKNTAEQIIAGWYAQLAAINKSVEKNGGIPNSFESDSMCKIAGNIEKLSKKHNLSTYHMVLKEFLKDIQVTDDDKAKIFAPLMLVFMNTKAAQLSK